MYDVGGPARLAPNVERDASSLLLLRKLTPTACMDPAVIVVVAVLPVTWTVLPVPLLRALTFLYQMPSLYAAFEQVKTGKFPAPHSASARASPGGRSSAAASSAAPSTPETNAPVPAMPSAFVRDDGPEREAWPERPAWLGFPTAASSGRAFILDPPPPPPMRVGGPNQQVGDFSL